MTQQFDHMGMSYSRSMLDYPGIRDGELKFVRSFLDDSLNSVLDFGCGDGFLTRYLRRIKPRCKVFGVEPSHVMRKEFQKKMQNDKNTSVVPSIEKIESFDIDASLSLGVFHHILDPRDILMKIKSVLHDRGRMIFIDFADNSPSQHYFDDLVNSFNGVGHIAFFISRSRAENLARATETDLISYKEQWISWRAKNARELSKFIRIHHGLLCSEKETLEHLENSDFLVEDGDGVGVLHRYAAFCLQKTKYIGV